MGTDYCEIKRKIWRATRDANILASPELSRQAKMLYVEISEYFKDMEVYTQVYKAEDNERFVMSDLKNRIDQFLNDNNLQ